MAETKVTSVFDMPHDAAAKARLDTEAEADVAAGRVVPHERVRESDFNPSAAARMAEALFKGRKAQRCKTAR